MKITPPKSLSSTTLLNMGIRITIVIIISAFLSYLHIIGNLEEQTLDKLEKYIAERVRKESDIFQLAEDNHRLFRESFLEIWLKRRDVPAQPRFSSLFDASDDGTVRLIQSAFYGRPHPHSATSEYMGESRWISGFVGRGTPINDNQFQNRLLLAYDLVDRFAEGWSNRFANTYVSLPEGANIVYWPHLNWAEGAASDLDIPSEEWVYIADKANNPQRKSVWTGLYYDQTANEWMVSCETPVDGPDGQHLINVGHDILLNNLFQRVFDDHLEGAHNFILRRDGRLVAHPHFTDAIRESKGLVSIPDIDDEHLQHQYQLITQSLRENGEQNQIVDDPNSDAFLAIAKIAGPDWYFVTVYPKQLLSTPAQEAARFIFMLGVVSLAVELLMLHLLLRRKVIRPIKCLEMSARQVREGNYGEVRQAFDWSSLMKRDDEIGNLSTTFFEMADHIHSHNATLEEQIEARTRELDQARLAAEELARTDPLTGLSNRRAFFEMGQRTLAVAKHGRQKLSVVMLDVDHFKTINDTYGHAVGDEVLKALGDELKQALRVSDLPARLGGEEFALLLDGCDLKNALKIAEELRLRLKKIAIPVGERVISFTSSFGIAQSSKDTPTLDYLIKIADLALYEAKRAGRDRIRAILPGEAGPTIVEA